MILAVEGLEFGYNSHPVLKDVRFEVCRGELFAILGNNGAGKSTLLRCLNRILTPRAGAILIDGEDLAALTRLDVARRVGYVAQRHESTRVTVFDAVLLGRRPHIRWDATEKDMAVVRGVLAALGLEEFSLRYLDELSGGELQKVIIARALAQEPRVLLLDEPTSNLDLRNQYEVLRIVKQAARERDIAAVVVMHDINLAMRFADRFLLDHLLGHFQDELGVSDRPFGIFTGVLLRRDEVDIPIEGEFPLLPQPLGDFCQSFGLLCDLLGEPGSEVHDQPPDIVLFRGFDAYLPQDSFEGQLYEFLRLADDVRIGFLLQEHREDLKSLRGFQEIALRQGLVGHISNSSPGS